MINRRRTLRALLTLAAAAGTSRDGNGFDGMRFSNANTSQESVSSLEDLLRKTIERFRRQTAATESRQLCEIALRRVHRSTEESAEFWQACTDSVCRLETLISRDENLHLPGAGRTTAALYQLRRLREHLADRTVQAIGGRGQL